MNKTLLACALAVASIGSASAATIIPVNMNAPGVGLNDPTPATPVGNNPGTTVGEQRQIAYQFAADLWGAVLESDVDIRVRAQFTPLSCTATSGVLGSAGTRQVFSDFPNAGLAETWYGGALANAIAGEDLAPAEDEINSNFNSNLGTTGCLENSGWYYGLDGNTPSGMINFLDVVMHEIGHGLNFQGFYSYADGTAFNGTPDVYSSHVVDNVSGLQWIAMTDAQRVAAATGDGLAWTGAEVTEQVPDALAPLERLFISGGLSASYDYGTAGFGAPATPANFNGAIVLVNDGSANPSQGCVASAPGAYAGKVALVDRGACAFEIKAKFAEDAGATAVIVANNVDSIAGMAEDPTVVATVPTIMVSQSAGTAIKAALPNATAAIQGVPGRYAGADEEARARLYAPAVLAPGSTFSHFDVSHVPNAIMEPSINQDLDANFRLDLTPALFADLGWTLNPGNATTNGGTCNTGVDAVQALGLIGGANLQASDALCRNANEGNTAGYRACIAPFVNRLRDLGLIPRTRASGVTFCTKR